MVRSFVPRSIMRRQVEWSAVISLSGFSLVFQVSFILAVIILTTATVAAPPFPAPRTLALRAGEAVLPGECGVGRSPAVSLEPAPFITFGTCQGEGLGWANGALHAVLPVPEWGQGFFLGIASAADHDGRGTVARFGHSFALWPQAVSLGYALGGEGADGTSPYSIWRMDLGVRARVLERLMLGAMVDRLNWPWLTAPAAAIQPRYTLGIAWWPFPGWLVTGDLRQSIATVNFLGALGSELRLGPVALRLGIEGVPLVLGAGTGVRLGPLDIDYGIGVAEWKWTHALALTARFGAEDEFGRSAAPETRRVDLNAAGEEELVRRLGIGRRLAAAIVEFRAGQGIIRHYRQLKKVSGMTGRILAQLNGKWTLGDGELRGTIRELNDATMAELVAAGVSAVGANALVVTREEWGVIERVADLEPVRELSKSDQAVLKKKFGE